MKKIKPTYSNHNPRSIPPSGSLKISHNKEISEVHPNVMNLQDISTRVFGKFLKTYKKLIIIWVV